MRPILLVAASANQRLPSGPPVRKYTSALVLLTGLYSTTELPLLVLAARTPNLLVLNSANQIRLSGPRVMPAGRQFGVGMVNCLSNTPLVFMTPMTFAFDS